MIVCAQTKSCPDTGSLQNSLNNSYISNDSAIAGCGKHKWQYSKLGGRIGLDENNNNNNCHLNQQPGHAIFNQFYFEQMAHSVPAQGGGGGVKTSNERTPLVGLHLSNKLGAAHETQLYGNLRQQYLSHPNLDSCSIDVGFAVKNSACLVKARNGDEEEDVELALKSPNGAESDEHEAGWLNSYWVLLPMLPLTLSLKLLTPLKFKNTCWTIWTFIVSIGLIGALTYVCVWMVHLFSEAMGIPETVAGMTILSWGTGIPELIASIVLIKKTAQADMAICNTIGSNVIDASFCLSLPW